MTYTIDQIITSSSVCDFYKDKCIFITGATGFVGKVLIEKLLRSCPELERIYVLIRPRGNQTVSTRLKNLLNGQIFSLLHETNPRVFEKVIAIAGDILLPSMGISAADKELLINHVSVVFHGAASIKFNDTLKYATQMNVFGTLKVADLCKQMRKLTVLIYVSTAFSNCNRSDIGEKMYPAPLEPSKLLSIADWMEEPVLETISAKLVGDRITTYHLTKSIAEKVLENESHRLPITIVRPSVIVGVWKEPIRGYTETLYHINGILVGAGRGVLRLIQCNPSCNLDIIPVDIVANLIIVTAWSRAVDKSQNGLMIYNCVNGVDRPLTYKELKDYTLPVMRNKPLLYPLWYPGITLVKYKIVAMFIMFFLHTIPSFIVDTTLRLVGMEPGLGKVMKKIERTQQTTEYFLKNDFNFSNTNVMELWQKLTPEDQNEFYFDIRELEWKQYLENYFLGCKQYVVKEELSTIPRARSQMRIMKWLYYFLSWFVVVPLLCWFLVAVT